MFLLHNATCLVRVIGTTGIGIISDLSEVSIEQTRVITLRNNYRSHLRETFHRCAERRFRVPFVDAAFRICMCVSILPSFLARKGRNRRKT